MSKIKVLIIDDSALVRRMLRAILQNDAGIEVCGEAPDAYVARELIKQHQPDVLTLDVEMPKMDGLTFLSNLMRLRPTPVVMISSLTEAGAAVTLEALEIGAIDFVAKPKLDLAHGLDASADEIISKVKMAAKVKLNSAAQRPADRPKPERLTASPLFRTTDRLIAIGASTGGTEAIRTVLSTFPPDAPGIVITQHIPQGYSKAFAQRLDKNSALTVCQADDGQRILPGHAYVAPGGKHLAVVRSGAHWYCKVFVAEQVNRHMPSVDVLFRSVVESAGMNATGLLLTGMGDDGAKGLLEMKQAGCLTICQDEATSVVWGMSGTAVRMGAATMVAPLDEIAELTLTRGASHKVAC